MIDESEENTIYLQTISDKIIDNSCSRRVDINNDERLVCGIDVCSYMRNTVTIQFRKGNDARSYKKYSIYLDSVKDIDNIIDILYKVKPDIINVSGGSIGSLIKASLSELAFNAYEIELGKKPINNTHYSDTASELWHTMRTWLFNYGCINENDLFMKYELETTEFKIDNKDRISVEDKLSRINRVGMSSNSANALALTFAEHVVPSNCKCKCKCNRKCNRDIE
ncbi:hypothetical protein [Bathymodiolus japonicus methanotrophic gill symbiont]|uniref:hypothetical protein n=1 Tax=Bathymodiolus japonicus methanotrophic gill symbiont TaxID=113269 RepID=UPI001C8E1378|nr:hypothetical protein [Bathymodiolus japonicus methanotrophic gill symbiont]